MARHKVARLQLTLDRSFLLAAGHAVGAAGVELAALGRVGGRRDAALQHDTVHLHRGIGDGDGGEQGFGVGVQRVAEDILRGSGTSRGTYQYVTLVSQIRELISDIQAELMYNKKFIHYYGKKFKFGDWSDGDFTTTDGAKFMAMSPGQSPRGLREGNQRPDYIVIDDVDTKQRCNNDELSGKLLWSLCC